MHYIVHCLDHDGAVEKRLANYDAHKAYLGAAKTKTLISGPLLADDNETMIGSLFLFEADNKEEIVTFNKADPKYLHIFAAKSSLHLLLTSVSQCLRIPRTIHQMQFQAGRTARH